MNTGNKLSGEEIKEMHTLLSKAVEEAARRWNGRVYNAKDFPD